MYDLFRGKHMVSGGPKSRGNFPVIACVGCEDSESPRCCECLGRPQDKRKKISSKGFDNDTKSV